YLCRLSVALLVTANGVAQAQHMPIDVLADRITIGTDFVPRYLDLPRVLVVPAGKIFTPLPDSTWDYIEVVGTLRVSRTPDPVPTLVHSLPACPATATVEEDPLGWRVGDELLLPDTALGGSRREGHVYIAGISGRTIALSKPLDFEHAAVGQPDGTIVLKPRV